jgi:hypothetical protein
MSATAGVVAVAKAPPSKIAARIPKLREGLMRAGTKAKLVNSNLLQVPAILSHPLSLLLSNTSPRLSLSADYHAPPAFMKTRNGGDACNGAPNASLFSSNDAEC